MSATQTSSVADRKDLAALAATHAKCRFCGTQLRHTVANLGMSPMANAIRKPEDLNKMEPFFPLHAYVCSNCFLVQLEEFQSGEAIFSDYAYFSSYVQAMLDHGKRYADEMTERFKLEAQTTDGPYGPARICNAADRPSPRFSPPRTGREQVLRLW